jgi:HEAT repeat protein
MICAAMGLFDSFKKKPQVPARPDPELERLVGDLKAPDWETRFAAANRLADLRERAAPAQSALEDATADDNDDVCTAAADALSAIRRALDGR